MADLSGTESNPVYEKLVALLDTSRAKYSILDHADDGQTDRVSAMRGHPVREAAKCIVLIVKQGKKTSKFLLAVVPGDCRVDTNSIKKLFNATYVGFEVAEKLAGSVAGTVLPFTLDRSLKLATADYLAIARPRIESIAVG